MTLETGQDLHLSTSPADQQEWQDAYTRLRKKVRSNLAHSKMHKALKGPLGALAEYLAVLPDLFHLALRMLFDPVMPLQKKALMLAALTYVVSPIDVIPDVIPVLGQMDDLVVLTKALKLLLDDSDPALRAAAEKYWAGEQDLLRLLTEIVDVADQLLSDFPAGFKTVLDKILSK